MNKSQQKLEVKHIDIRDLGKNLANQTVLIRARLHTSRGKGTYISFIAERNFSEEINLLKVSKRTKYPFHTQKKEKEKEETEKK